MPLIYWPRGMETATALKRAGIDQIAVPPERVEEWRKAGFSVLGIAQDELSDKPEKNVKKIDKAASKMFKNFPPGSEKK